MPAFGIPAFVPPNIPPGKVVQIVSATTDTQLSTSSATYADTGLTATITPKSSANKVLVFVTQAGLAKGNNNTSIAVRLYRGATLVAQVESAAGQTGTTADNFIGSVAGNYLDSPASVAAVTYKTQFNSTAGLTTGTIQVFGSTSSIVLMEVTP